MGHRSREAGKAFEERIENALECARQQGLVGWYAHQQPLITRFGKPIAQSGADYVFVLKGGLAGALEAKSTKGKRLARSAIAIDQAAHLDATARAGGLALLAVEFRDEQSGVYRPFVVPWRSVPWETAISAESVTADALDEYRMPSTGMIAQHVTPCASCASLHPRVGTMVCCRASAPF